MQAPLFSILLPTFNPDPGWLSEALLSVINQTCKDWELCIADDKSTDPEVRKTLEKYSRMDPRVKCTFRETNGHIAEASNSALELASGTWIVLMDHDDLLPPEALNCLAEVIHNHPEARLIYSDEDKIQPRGTRHAPYYKCDWNRDLFYSHNLISHLGAYHGQTLKEVGGFRAGLEGSQDYDLALRFLEKVGDYAIYHIPAVLYHWREHSGSTSSGHAAKSYVMEAGIRALNDHYDRIGDRAHAHDGGMGSYRTVHVLPDDASVEFFVTWHGDERELRVRISEIESECAGVTWSMTLFPVGGLVTRSRMQKFSDHPQITIWKEGEDAPMATRINQAAKNSRAGYLHFLPDTLKPLGTGWLPELISQAARPEIGAVGAMLLYPDGRVRQAGLLLDPLTIFRRAFHHYHGDSPGYMGRLRLVQNFSAVGIDGMMIARDKFLQAGGFDETALKSRYHDVDLCLRIRDKGLRNLWTPHARFVERSPFPRIREWVRSLAPKARSDRKVMRSRWGGMLLADPCYGQNLDQRRKDFHCPSR
jgi:glycosyltransferase involved in cell wall biosynthesis